MRGSLQADFVDGRDEGSSSFAFQYLVFFRVFRFAALQFQEELFLAQTVLNFAYSGEDPVDVPVFLVPPVLERGQFGFKFQDVLVDVVGGLPEYPQFFQLLLLGVGQGLERSHLGFQVVIQVLDPLYDFALLSFKQGNFGDDDDLLAFELVDLYLEVGDVPFEFADVIVGTLEAKFPPAETHVHVLVVDVLELFQLAFVAVHVPGDLRDVLVEFSGLGQG
jgi:hypothetical protein